jgi:hypothetical protein
MKILNTQNNHKVSASDFGTLFEKKFLEEANTEGSLYDQFEKNPQGVDFSFGKSSVYGKVFSGLQTEFKVSTGPDFRIRFDKREALIDQAKDADVFLIAIVPEEIREVCLHEEFSILHPTRNTRRKQKKIYIEGEEEARLQFCIIPSREVIKFYSRLDTQDRFGTGIMPLDSYQKASFDDTRRTLITIKDHKYSIFSEKVKKDYTRNFI